MQREKLYNLQRTALKDDMDKNKYGWLLPKMACFRNIEIWSLGVLLILKTKKCNYAISRSL